MAAATSRSATPGRTAREGRLGHRRQPGRGSRQDVELERVLDRSQVLDQPLGGAQPVGGLAEAAPPGVVGSHADVPGLEADHRRIQRAQVLDQRVVVAARHQVGLEAGTGLQRLLTRPDRFLIAGVHQQIDAGRRDDQHAGTAKMARQVALVRRLGDDERVQLRLGQARAQSRQPDAQDRGRRE